MKILTDADVPCSRLNTVADVLADPQVSQRNMIVTVERPSGGKTRLPGSPISMSGTPKEVFECAPTLGQHTDQILAEILGHS